MIKSYIALNSLHLITSIVLGEMVFVVEFKGGRITPQGRVNGTFATDNAALQKAIEADPNYGVQFVLHKTGGQKTASPHTETSKNGLVNVPAVNSRQRAIEWIAENLDMESPRSMSSRAVRRVAQERGFVFENWNER